MAVKCSALSVVNHFDVARPSWPWARTRSGGCVKSDRIG